MTFGSEDGHIRSLRRLQSSHAWVGIPCLTYRRVENRPATFTWFSPPAKVVYWGVAVAHGTTSGATSRWKPV